jgi:hypothetical protein
VQNSCRQNPFSEQCTLELRYFSNVYNRVIAVRCSSFLFFLFISFSFRQTTRTLFPLNHQTFENYSGARRILLVGYSFMPIKLLAQHRLNATLTNHTHHPPNNPSTPPPTHMLLGLINEPLATLRKNKQNQQDNNAASNSPHAESLARAASYIFRANTGDRITLLPAWTHSLPVHKISLSSPALIKHQIRCSRISQDLHQ